jgi:hypothetical protein
MFIMFMFCWSALLTPHKATLDSMHTLSWSVSYRRLSPQFQFSLSVAALGIYLYGATCTDKKEIKFSSYLRKFRMEQLQSHIWLTAFSYMGKYLCISSYIRKPFLIYDFATAPLWISLLYEENFLFFFISVPGKWQYYTASSCWYTFKASHI